MLLSCELPDHVLRLVESFGRIQSAMDHRFIIVICLWSQLSRVRISLSPKANAFIPTFPLQWQSRQMGSRVLVPVSETRKIRCKIVSRLQSFVKIFKGRNQHFLWKSLVLEMINVVETN